MKRKQRIGIFLCCFSFFILYPVQVQAEYFTHHTDWTSYCMQARDVQITDRERKEWISEGTLDDNLVKRSELFTNRFHASDDTQYWTKYTGKYFVDTSQLEAFQFPKGENVCDVSVTFYLDEEDKGWNYITVMVRIVADESTYQNKDEKSSQTSFNKKETHQFSKETKKYVKPFMIWNLMGIIALISYGASLYSDFKVLKRYKEKKMEGDC
ncbi:MAG: hypothetical protein PHT21_12850 [Lachnospiraceae bacterium]|nr:hypothetical protein [Lachnospiraceae bacterium]